MSPNSGCLLHGLADVFTYTAKGGSALFNRRQGDFFSMRPFSSVACNCFVFANPKAEAKQIRHPKNVFDKWSKRGSLWKRGVALISNIPFPGCYRGVTYGVTHQVSAQSESLAKFSKFL